MSFRSAWLLGSYADLPLQTVTVGVTPLAIYGSCYLWDPVPALGLCGKMQNALLAGGVSGGSVVLLQSGRVRISADDTFAVIWGTALLRDLLGFTASLGGAASYTAPLRSPLWWSPGKPETPLAQRLGVRGQKRWASYQAVAPYSGRTESVTHGFREFARYSFPMVDTDRLHSEADLGGEFGRWFDLVAMRAARWKLYRQVIEDPAGTSSAVPSLLATPSLGPYVVTAERGGLAWSWNLSRGLERTDLCGDIEVPCHVVEEYS